MITINGIEFTPKKGIKYKSDYVAAYNYIAQVRDKSGEVEAQRAARTIFRGLFLSDLFFIVYFIFKNPIANHEFVVNTCKEIENGPKSMTLDVWAREHFKSSIITKAETLQYHANPTAWHSEVKDGSTCFLSATSKLSKKILSQMMEIMKNEANFLNFMFPHRPDLGYWGPFWDDPENQAPQWNVDRGVKLRRRSISSTPCMFAAGLEAGMPTGDHYGRMVFDDITNPDVAESPQRMSDLKVKFDVAQDIGTIYGHSRVVGTFYHWADPLVYVRDKKKAGLEEPLYLHRIKPATHDGSFNGVPVFLPPEKLEEKKTQSTYSTQQLCNPTPTEIRKLDSSMLKTIKHNDIPEVIKLMAVDPAGERQDGKGDNWAMAVVGVKPNSDDLGASEFYVMDLIIDRLDEASAPLTCAQMYLRGGMIHVLGVEKTAQSTAEIHIANMLKKHGRHLSRDAKNLMILRPAKREKSRRIESGWAYPLANGKVFVSDRIPEAYRKRLESELDNFPYSANDDGSDILAYIFKDMMADQDIRNLMSTYSQERVDLSEITYRTIGREDEGHKWLAN